MSASFEQFTQAEAGLRKAVRLRRYADIGGLAEAFCAAAVTYRGSLAPGDPAAAGLADRVLGTIEWARVMLLAARAANADELRRLPCVNRYLAAPRTPAPACVSFRA